MTLAAVVTAHPNRAERAESLAATIDASIVWDEHNHIWDTTRRALLTDTTADYLMVVQDDAVVSDRLTDAVTEIVTAHPGRLVNLYLGAVKPVQVQARRWTEAATESDATLIEAKGPYWGVACVYPTNQLPELVEWCDRYANAGQSYDGRVTAWSNTHKVDWLYAWPSLVDHDTTVPSLHSSTSDRRAIRFIGADRTALGSDWSKVQRTDPESLHPPVWFVHRSTGRRRKVGRRTPGFDRLTRHGTWDLVE